MYDLIIIGMGPAGMNAALYAKRSGMNVLLLEKNIPGGLINITNKVENYLGVGIVTGAELVDKMVNHIKEFNIEGVSTRFDEEIVIAENALSSSLICLQRFSDLGKGASGWCVESIEKRQDDKYHTIETKKYSSCYAYELLQKREALIKALAFPFGYIIVFDGDSIVEILNENDISLIQ